MVNKEREIAINILAEFEDFLNVHNVKIPNKEREVYDCDEDTEPAILFGSDYYILEDKITEIIKNGK